MKKTIKMLLSYFNLRISKVNNGLLSKSTENQIFHGMEVLPGTDYSNFLMPLDYKPSRNFTPRWGYSTPVHKIINELFSKNDESYLKAINGIKLLKNHYNNIAIDYAEKNLPNPAWNGVPISPIDTASLYYFITKYKPEIYLEIGSGSTTCFAKRAIIDHNLNTKIISIDPQPRAEIDQICDFVVRDSFENYNLDIFKKLKKNDIVFLDGSHRSFMNSDVTVFMLDVLPYLPEGVIVHIHDILLPYDYPDSFKNWYWNEQYILAAYLIGTGSNIDYLFPSAYVSKSKKFDKALDEALFNKDVTWGGGGSLWFTHKKQLHKS